MLRILTYIRRLLGGRGPDGLGTVTREVVRTGKLSEPAVGVRFWDYVKSGVGLLRSHLHGHEAERAQAIRDAHCYEEDIASGSRELEAMKDQRAEHPHSALLFLGVPVCLAAEYAGTLWVWISEGMSVALGSLTSLGTTVMSLVIVHVMDTRRVKDISFWAAALAFSGFAVAMGAVRSADVGDGGGDMVGWGFVALAVFSVVGPPIGAQRFLKLWLEMSRLDRRIALKERTVAELKAVQTEARQYLYDAETAETEQRDWINHYGHATLAQFPEYFIDPNAKGATDSGGEMGADDAGLENSDVNLPCPGDETVAPQRSGARTRCESGGGGDAGSPDEEPQPLPRFDSDPN